MLPGDINLISVEYPQGSGPVPANEFLTVRFVYKHKVLGNSESTIDARKLALSSLLSYADIYHESAGDVEIIPASTQRTYVDLSVRSSSAGNIIISSPLMSSNEVIQVSAGSVPGGAHTFAILAQSQTEASSSNNAIVRVYFKDKYGNPI